VAKKTESNVGFFTDYWLVKIKADGRKDWDKTVGGTQDDNLKSAFQLSDSNFLLFGSSFSGISGDKSVTTRGGADYWVVKLDNNISYKKEQIITFGSITYKDYLSQKTFALTAVSSGGLPISYNIVSGPATVKGNLLTLTGTGTVIVEANQAGNASYDPANNHQ